MPKLEFLQNVLLVMCSCSTKRRANSRKRVRWLPSILRYYLPCKARPVLKIINLMKEMRNSRVFVMLRQGFSQQVPDIGRPPRERAAAKKLRSNKLAR